MISQEIVNQQLQRIGVGSLPLVKSELAELPQMMIPGEEIEQLLAGRYIAGYAIMVATNYRLLIIDKKLGGGLIFEDVPFDMIAEIQYVHTPFSTQLTVHARSKKIVFKAFGERPVREFAQHLEQRMMEARRQMQTMQSPFAQNNQQQETQNYGNQRAHQGTSGNQPGLHLP